MIRVSGPTHRTRGFTVIEVMIALSIVTVLLTAALGGVRAHQIAVAREWSRLEASRAASSRLEVLGGTTHELRSGEAPFETTMKGARGTERIRLLEPGLYEVRVEVRHPADGVNVVLTTLVAKEVAP